MLIDGTAIQAMRPFNPSWGPGDYMVHSVWSDCTSSSTTATLDDCKHDVRSYVGSGVPFKASAMQGQPAAFGPFNYIWVLYEGNYSKTADSQNTGTVNPPLFDLTKFVTDQGFSSAVGMNW